MGLLDTFDPIGQPQKMDPPTVENLALEVAELRKLLHVMRQDITACTKENEELRAAISKDKEHSSSQSDVLATAGIHVKNADKKSLDQIPFAALELQKAISVLGNSEPELTAMIRQALVQLQSGNVVQGLLAINDMARNWPEWTV